MKLKDILMLEFGAAGDNKIKKIFIEAMKELKVSGVLKDKVGALISKNVYNIESIGGNDYRITKNNKEFVPKVTYSGLTNKSIFRTLISGKEY